MQTVGGDLILERGIRDLARDARDLLAVDQERQLVEIPFGGHAPAEGHDTGTRNRRLKNGLLVFTDFPAHDGIPDRLPRHVTGLGIGPFVPVAKRLGDSLHRERPLRGHQDVNVADREHVIRIPRLAARVGPGAELVTRLLKGVGRNRHLLPGEAHQRDDRIALAAVRVKGHLPLLGTPVRDQVEQVRVRDSVGDRDLVALEILPPVERLRAIRRRRLRHLTKLLADDIALEELAVGQRTVLVRIEPDARCRLEHEVRQKTAIQSGGASAVLGIHPPHGMHLRIGELVGEGRPSDFSGDLGHRLAIHDEGELIGIPLGGDGPQEGQDALLGDLGLQHRLLVVADPAARDELLGLVRQPGRRAVRGKGPLRAVERRGDTLDRKRPLRLELLVLGDDAVVRARPPDAADLVLPAREHESGPDESVRRQHGVLALEDVRGGDEPRAAIAVEGQGPVLRVPQRGQRDLMVRNLVGGGDQLLSEPPAGEVLEVALQLRQVLERRADHVSADLLRLLHIAEVARVEGDVDHRPELERGNRAAIRAGCTAAVLRVAPRQFVRAVGRDLVIKGLPADLAGDRRYRPVVDQELQRVKALLRGDHPVEPHHAGALDDRLEDRLLAVADLAADHLLAVRIPRGGPVGRERAIRAAERLGDTLDGQRPLRLHHHVALRQPVLGTGLEQGAVRRDPAGELVAGPREGARGEFDLDALEVVRAGHDAGAAVGIVGEFPGLRTPGRDHVERIRRNRIAVTDELRAVVPAEEVLDRARRNRQVGERGADDIPLL